MNPKTPLSIFDKIYKSYSGSLGKMLIHTGVIGWVLSSLAQITAIICNDKISKEQKMFLIPQEAADAVVNILSFYAVTRTLSSVASKLALTGKWLPKNVKNYLIKHNYANQLGKIGFDISKLKLPSRIKTSFNRFGHGLDVSATTIGAVISCNIITPLLRNLYASKRQKTYMKKFSNEPKITPNKKVNTYNYVSMNAFKNGVYSNNYSLKI